jgi:hypothetical protein
VEHPAISSARENALTTSKNFINFILILLCKPTQNEIMRSELRTAIAMRSGPTELSMNVRFIRELSQVGLRFFE